MRQACHVRMQDLHVVITGGVSRDAIRSGRGAERARGTGGARAADLDDPVANSIACLPADVSMRWRVGGSWELPAEESGDVHSRACSVRPRARLRSRATVTRFEQSFFLKKICSVK